MQRESSDSVKIYYPEFSRDELLARLVEGAKRLAEKLPLACVLLFGSYAKNKQTAASDVDLLVVYRDPKNDADYSLVWDEIEIPILEPHIYTVSEFEKQSKFLREATRDGILVYGEIPR